MATRTMRFKINAMIVMTCVVTALIWASLFYPFEKRRRQTHIQNIRILMETIYEQKKDDLANEIFAGQKAAIQITLAKIMKVERVAHVAVYELNGQLMASTNSYDNDPFSIEERTRLAQSPIFERRLMGNHAFATFATIVEVVGERVGYFVMSYDLQPMEQESLVTLASFLLLILLTLTLTMLMLNMFLNRTVIRPTSMLRHAIVRLRSGGWGEQVDIRSNDEIGEVAEAFNDMSLQLSAQHAHLSHAIKEKETYAGQMESTNRALEDLNARLEEIVEERTMELRARNEQLKEEIRERQSAEKAKQELQERLTRSQKMEALGLLAGGVAHDLNNVLSGMVSYPDLLLMDIPADHKLRKPIETIRASGQKAAAIVQDLLTLARRGVVNPMVIDLNRSVVQEYLESPEHQKLLTFHPDVLIQSDLSSDLMNIKGSAVHLRKALMNLVSNAAEAQPDGGEVIIRTRNQYMDTPLQGYDHVNEGDYVVLEVSDRGTGIEPQDLERIFEPFYSKKVMGRSGTGLGMAVVWGTVQDHHGYINVRSTPGIGTVFHLYFPVTRELNPQGPGVTIPADFMGSGQTILVVDDVDEQRRIATQILTRLNYKTHAVSSGEEAVEFLRHTPVDILVLDMIMDPGMDGLDTYTRILEFMPAQKAVIASGYAENERVKQAQALGAGPYIRKPYAIDKLGQAIHFELNR